MAVQAISPQTPQPIDSSDAARAPASTTIDAEFEASILNVQDILNPMKEAQEDRDYCEYNYIPISSATMQELYEKRDTAYLKLPKATALVVEATNKDTQKATEGVFYKGFSNHVFVLDTPNKLHKLHKLHELRIIDDTQLQSEISSDFCHPELFVLPSKIDPKKVHSFWLQTSRIVNLSFLALFPNLKQIVIRDCAKLKDLSTLPSELNSVNRAVIVFNKSMTSLKGIENCKNLTSLVVNRSGIAVESETKAFIKTIENVEIIPNIKDQQAEESAALSSEK